MILKTILKKDMRVLKENTFTMFTMLLLTKAWKDSSLMYMSILMTKKAYNSYQDSAQIKSTAEIFYHSNRNLITLIKIGRAHV